MRKALFLFCIMMSAVLFIDGLYMLSIYGKTPEPAREERVKNRTIQYQQPETSLYIPPADPVTSTPVNLLVLGLDGEEVRSDVILLLNYSKEDNGLNILSVARDTKVTARGRTVKINALAAMGGIPLLAQKLEDLTGLPVDYYMTLNFGGFRQIVDILGGVSINVPFNMNYDDPEQSLHIHLKKGWQVLNGKRAEQFVRYRKGNSPGQGYREGDLGRIGAQQDFIKALIEQKLKLKYLSKIDDIYFVLKRNMKTNIELGDIRYYLKYVKNLRSGNVRSFTIPGESEYVNRTWYFVTDREKTLELVDTNFYR